MPKNKKMISAKSIIRFFDMCFAGLGLVLTSPVILIVLVLGYFDTKSPIFVQQRVGKNKRSFNLYKFRTMKISTQHTATHLVDKSSITKLGSFLRKTKIDELPQLINVLKGDMSLAGPRPCLLSQTELIIERELRGVFNVRPGITGLAQINNVDMSDPEKLAIMDKEMIADFSIAKYFNYIFLTILGKGFGDRVK